MTTYHIDYAKPQHKQTIIDQCESNKVAYVIYPSIDRISIFSTLNKGKEGGVLALLWVVKATIPMVNIKEIKGCSLR